MNDEPEKMSVEDFKITTNKIIYLGFTSLLVTVLAMTTCTMHSNTYDSERLEQEVKVAMVEVQLEQKKLEIKELAVKGEAAKLEIIERMVKNGTNPISAACAILGFNQEDIGCIVAASNHTPPVPQEE